MQFIEEATIKITNRFDLEIRGRIDDDGDAVYAVCLDDLIASQARPNPSTIVPSIGAHFADEYSFDVMSDDLASVIEAIVRDLPSYYPSRWMDDEEHAEAIRIADAWIATI